MLVGWYFLLFTSAITWSTLRQELGHKFDLMMLITLCVSVGCYCIFALYTYVFAVTGFYLYHQAIYLQFLAAPSFVNPRFLMQFIGLSLPFTVLPLLLYRKQLSYWAYPWALLCAYFWCLGFANQSRTIYFEVIVIPLILLALFGKKALPWLKIQGLLAIFGFILYLLLFKAIIYFAGRFDSAHFFAQFSSNNGRFLLWGTAFLLWKSHPLLGVGPLHYSYYAFNYEHIAAHPHNNFILIACEWGSIAVLALLSLSLWGVWRWCQKARLWQEEKTQLFVVALTASLFIGMLDGLFSGNIVMPLSQITLVLILAWLFGVYCATNIPTTIAPTRFKHWILLAALLIAGIWVVRGMAPILPLLTKEYLVALGNCQGGVCLLNPSFWTQGWIQYYPH